MIEWWLWAHGIASAALGYSTRMQFGDRRSRGNSIV